MQVTTITNRSTKPKIILNDELVIEISLPLLSGVSSAIRLDFSDPVNLDRYREDVANILTDEFGFNILQETVLDKYSNPIKDLKTGLVKMARGHASNRNDSISLYFGVSYDITKSNSWCHDNRIPRGVDASAKCKVIVKVADHQLFNQSNVATRDYDRDLLDAVETEFGPHDVTISDSEELIKISEKIYGDYEAGLDEVREEVKRKIQEWRFVVARKLLK